MTNYNIRYTIPKPTQHLPCGRELTPMEKELMERVKRDKKARQQVIAKAQTLEHKAYRLKMQRLRTEAGKYEDEPA